MEEGESLVPVPAASSSESLFLSPTLVHLLLCNQIKLLSYSFDLLPAKPPDLIWLSSLSEKETQCLGIRTLWPSLSLRLPLFLFILPIPGID